MPAKPKSEPMCAVTIDFQTYLMPASAGMKVVQLLQGAVNANMHWDGKNVYVVKGPADVEFRSVRADQIHMPEPVQRLLLEKK